MDKIGTGAWQPQIIYKKLKWSDRPIGNKCWFVLLTFFKILYKCFYFYFFPFITMMINIASPTCTSIILIDELQSYISGQAAFSGVCSLGNHLVVDSVFRSDTIWVGPYG